MIPHRIKRNIKIIFESGLFDINYYNKQFEIPPSSPIQHYVQIGWRQGKNPNPNFDTQYYLEKNPDVAASVQRFNPFAHWLLYGKKEKRITKDNNMNILNKKIIQSNMNIYSEKININCALLCHIGNYDIFLEITKDFPLFFRLDLYFSVHNKEILQKIKNIFPKSHVVIVENRGMDIGGFFNILHYMKNNKLCNYDIYIKIHTKTDKKWRDKMFRPLHDNIKNICAYKIKNIPILFGADEYLYINTKQINKKNMLEIINKYFPNNNYQDYCDRYINEDNYNFPKDREIFLFNEKFYKSYEYDLKHLGDAKTHWHSAGRKEFHRINNPCYIKKFAKYRTYFIAGTCFAFNQKYMQLLLTIDHINEFKLMEPGRSINILPTIVHSWEYIFGVICYLNNGFIITFDNAHLYKNEISEQYIKEQAVINVYPTDSTIACFMLITDGNTTSGGYRTLLKYIHYLNELGYTVDLYFGNDKDHSLLNKDGLSVIDMDINKIIDNVNKYNEIDINKNNFYLGLNCHKKYKILIANAWQISSSVYNNKDYCEKLAYIIQDREELFYLNNAYIQKQVIDTYKPEFNYYCLSQYLTNYFKNVYKFNNIYESMICYDHNIYYDKGNERENSVVIAYYTYKAGRLPNMVEKIINILTNNQIHCHIFPSEYKSNSEYVHNYGYLDINKLNDMYNKYKVGIVFSNTNLSRLSNEMYGSGLKVIEYDSEFTEHDLPNKYFTKIKDEKDILDVVEGLFEDNEKNSEEYKKTKYMKYEKNNLLEFFADLM